MSKEVADPLRADYKFVIPNLSLSYHHFVPTHPSYSWFRSGFERNDVKSALRHICCLKFYLDFLWRLVNSIQLVGSPSYIFHVIVLDEIRKNPLNTCRCRSYIARMRQQPEDVDHMRCSPTNHQNITLGSNIALCSMLERFCCM